MAKEKFDYYFENGKIVIIEDGKKCDYANPLRDRFFKSILKADKNHIILTYLFKELLNIDVEKIEEVDSEYKIKGINERQEATDYIVKVNGQAIQIECNFNYSDKLKTRNISHYKRFIKEYGLPAVIINFDDYDVEKKNEFLYHYELKAEKESVFYNGLLDIYHFNLSYFNKIVYTKDVIDKLSKLEFTGLLFKTRTREEIDVLIERDERLMEIKKIYEEISNDEEFIEEYTKEELEKFAYGEEERKEGMEQGAKEEKQEIARNMLDLNISIEDIKKCTGLSEEEIEKLR